MGIVTRYPVARTCDNEVGVAISIRDPYTSPFTSRCKRLARCLLLVRCSGSCASTEGTSDEYCRRDSEAAANATFQAVNTKRRKYGDWKRTFHKDWELDYLVIYESKSDTCICSAIAHSQLLKSISYNDTMKNAPRNSFME